MAAHKIFNGNDFALLRAAFGEAATDFDIDTILDEGDLVDTGSHRLRVLHTPGHSSGSISLFEEQDRLLVTGDTVLAGGNLGGVFASGNISESQQLPSDTRILFETLNAQDSINKVILSLRDLNRSFA